MGASETQAVPGRTAGAASAPDAERGGQPRAGAGDPVPHPASGEPDRPLRVSPHHRIHQQVSTLRLPKGHYTSEGVTCFNSW